MAKAHEDRQPGDITGIGANSTENLRRLLERIETLEEEKKGIADDIKDVYAEAKSVGFDTKTMRAVARWRKMEPAARKGTDSRRARESVSSSSNGRPVASASMSVAVAVGSTLAAVSSSLRVATHPALLRVRAWWRPFRLFAWSSRGAA